MNYYNLVSCNPSVYPTLGPFVHPVLHPYNGVLVYQPSTPTQIYTLTYIGDFAAGAVPVPALDVSAYSTCSQTEHIYTLINCQTGAPVSYLFTSAQTFGSILRFANDCNCYRVDDYEEGTVTAAPTIAQVYTECSTCLQDLNYVNCDVSEVSKRFAVRAALPAAPQPDRGFDSCCFELKVLADIADASEYRNDYTSVFYTKQTPSDTVAFKLVEVGGTAYNLNGGTYGDITTNGDTTAFKVLWRNVLTLLGAGAYQIRKDITTAGITTQVLSNTFKLYSYSVGTADRTVKIEATFNGRFESLGTSFFNYNTSIRLPGFFGRAEPSYTQDNLIHNDYVSRQVSISVENEYTLQSNLLPSCITSEVLYFLLLADDLKITDYNLNNHSYELVKVPVLLQDNAGTGYYVRSRDAVLNLTFVDKLKNQIKRNC